ncbi:VPLPA-CTERM sorting domain-containing protein [Sedimentitalea sp. HM32M-2]|uniref:VPLPA-CTERM sorting domain-containing protein n=1 Tax=Sedimentitalea sp. HM32M-2 TaxID=3351566 RepID=UPI00363301EA
MFEGLKKLRLAAAVALATVASQSEALTIKLYDAGSDTTVKITDGSALDTLAEVGKISTGTVFIGGSSLQLSTAFVKDADGKSSLRITATDVAASDLGILKINVFHDDFQAAAANPMLSNVQFTMNASDLSDNGKVKGMALAGGQATGPYEFIAATSDTISQKTMVALDNPFSMQINTVISSGTNVTYDATLVAAVPVPAAGLLLLTALGGLGLARRRKAA